MQSAVLVSCLLVLAPPTLASLPEGEEESCGSDETPLLQLGHGAQKLCWGYPVELETQCRPIEAKLGKGQTLGWFDLPEQALHDVRGKVTPYTGQGPGLPGVTQFVERTTWGTAKAEAAMKMMYEATRVEPIFDEVPEVLRGVFWMKGNAIPEELCVLQYGKWFKEEGIYVATVAPLGWAWPAGRPRNAPNLGVLYSSGPSFGFNAGSVSAHFGLAISFKFSHCPDYAACHNQDKLGNMSFAYMQFHDHGNLKEVFPIGLALPAMGAGSPTGIFTGAFTIENSVSNPGNDWRREIRYGGGVLGQCAPVDFGSYDLVKVIDGAGKPVRHSYDEFVSYMGDVELLMWTGFQNETAKEELVSLLRAGKLD